MNSPSAPSASSIPKGFALPFYVPHFPGRRPSPQMGQRADPWGDEFDANRTNCHKTGLKATSAARYFSAGVSPCGAYDLSGNVFEWTRSLWGKDWEKSDFGYPFNPNDNREQVDAPKEILRVSRGGAFEFGADGVRCPVHRRKGIQA